MATLKRTIKHDVIKSWVEAHGGVPARVRTTSDALTVKIGTDEPTHDPISWEDWFSVFDDKEFAFVFEDHGYGSKVVKRNGKEEGSTG